MDNFFLNHYVFSLFAIIYGFFLRWCAYDRLSHPIGTVHLDKKKYVIPDREIRFLIKKVDIFNKKLVQLNLYTSFVFIYFSAANIIITFLFKKNIFYTSQEVIYCIFLLIFSYGMTISIDEIGEDGNQKIRSAIGSNMWLFKLSIFNLYKCIDFRSMHTVNDGDKESEKVKYLKYMNKNFWVIQIGLYIWYFTWIFLIILLTVKIIKSLY